MKYIGVIWDIEKLKKKLGVPSTTTHYNDELSVSKFATWLFDEFKNIACTLINEEIGWRDYLWFENMFKSFTYATESYSLIRIIITYTSHILYAPILILTIVLIAAFLVLLERRIIAAIHRRQGPNRVGKGYLQPIADALKLIFKENNKPTLANKFIFYFAPCLALMVSLVLCAFLPFYVNKVGVESHYSILYYYAFSSLSVLALIIAGWASKSKYPLLGTIRACAAIISYEVVISLILLIVALITQSAAFTGILYYQKINGWLFFNAPFLVPLFFIAALAELNRAPFDLTESEAELVAGYNVEYSGLLFAFFILAEYIHVINIGSIIVILFFGGGYPHIVIGDELLAAIFIKVCNNHSMAVYIISEWKSALSDIQSVCCYYRKYLEVRPSIVLFEQYYYWKFNLWCIFSYYAGAILYYYMYFTQLSSICYLIIFITKVLVFCLVTVVTRAITPRYRYDYLMYICWNTFVPVCLAYLLIVMWLIFSKFIV